MEPYLKYRIFIALAFFFVRTVSGDRAAAAAAAPCREYGFARSRLLPGTFRLDERRPCNGQPQYHTETGRLHLFYSKVLDVWVVGSAACDYYSAVAHGLAQPGHSPRSVSDVTQWRVLDMDTTWQRLDDGLMCVQDGQQNTAGQVVCGPHTVTVTVPRAGRGTAYVGTATDPACTPHTRHGRWVFSFPVSKCQPEISMSANSLLVHYNLVTVHPSRPSTKVKVSCEYPKTSVIASKPFLAKRVTYRSSNVQKGRFDVGLSLHNTTQTLTHKYTEGSHIAVGQRVYARVRLVSDVDLHMYVKYCYATPSKKIAKKYPKLKHYLIDELGCFSDHSFEYAYQSSRQFVFGFTMFQFVDPAHPAGHRLEDVELHCAAAVCPRDAAGRQQCRQPRDCSKDAQNSGLHRMKRAADLTEEDQQGPNYSVSFGFKVKDDPAAERKRPDRVIDYSSMAPVAGILFTVLVVSTVFGAVTAGSVKALYHARGNVKSVLVE